MNVGVLERKLARASERIQILEQMIETKTREVYIAHRELEFAHRNLMELHRILPSALIVADDRCLITSVNRTAVDLLGYAEVELVGRSLDRVCDGVSETLAALGGDADTSTVRRESTWYTAQGHGVPVLVSACLLRERAGGEPCSVVLVGVDLRERKQLEVELRHAQKLESIGQLAAGIAHEINTPMQFIGDNISFLAESFEDVMAFVRVYDTVDLPNHVTTKIERARLDADIEYLERRIPRAFERTLAGVSRVSSIVAAMKAFSHPQSEAGPVDINRAVETTLTVSRSEYKDLATLEIDLGVLPAVTGHGGDINQVLLNLVVNAAHAIEACSRGDDELGVISIATRHVANDVVIEVRDTGTGIAPEIQSRIFDPFFTTKDVGRGTGQGLSLAHAIVVDKHGGSLTFRTSMGEGTTFLVRLPVSGGPVAQEMDA